MATVLLTNVKHYAGPGAIVALRQSGADLICHDASFVDGNIRAQFETENPGVRALEAQSPEGIHAEVISTSSVPESIVSNDVYPITKNEIEFIPVEDLQRTFEAVVLFPIRLTQLFLPAMKSRRRGSFVFVTSARETRPEPGYAVPTTIRSATTTFAKALAKECAPFGIQANVVAPNYLYSEMYYPRDQFIDDPTGREAIARVVPFGRLGDQEEVGALITFFAMGASPFTTGQVIYFTGGWP